MFVLFCYHNAFSLTTYQIAEVKAIWPDVETAVFGDEKLLENVIGSLKTTVSEMDDLVDDLCAAFDEVCQLLRGLQSTHLFKFTAFRTWTDNLGYEIDLCRFDFSTGLNFIDYLENGLEWINWNFQLFDLFLELYVKDQQTL